MMRSTRGLSREEDDVHKLMSTLLAFFSTYVSLNEKNTLLAFNSLAIIYLFMMLLM